MKNEMMLEPFPRYVNYAEPKEGYINRRFYK